jgi:hypothetical protein
MRKSAKNGSPITRANKIAVDENRLPHFLRYRRLLDF